MAVPVPPGWSCITVWGCRVTVAVRTKQLGMGLERWRVCYPVLLLAMFRPSACTIAYVSDAVWLSLTLRLPCCVCGFVDATSRVKSLEFITSIPRLSLPVAVLLWRRHQRCGLHVLLRQRDPANIVRTHGAGTGVTISQATAIVDFCQRRFQATMT